MKPVKIQLGSCLRLFAAKAAAAMSGIGLLVGCSNMTDREEKMVGHYFNPALSDVSPVLELGEDNCSVMRSIRPGELSYSVSGKWHIKNDSLIIDNDESTINIEMGDPGLVGSVKARVAYAIITFDERVLRFEKEGGLIYDYHRRRAD